MPVLVRALERGLALGQDLVLGQVRELEQGLRAQGQAAPAWVLDRGQALGKGDLGPAALKDRTDLVLVMEPAIAVLARQTVRALAPVWAGMDPAPVGTNASPFSLLKRSPHPIPLSQCGVIQGEGAPLTR
jgi:hypothetical protein